jgi:predicted flap endonuclease-1-like 5' DNA nuclease
MKFKNMTKKVLFNLPSEYVAGATHGILVGDFNNWNTAEGIYLEKFEDGSFGAELFLTEGKTYEYRYLLSDGRWVNDNNSKKSVLAFGQTIENCVIDVPVSDAAVSSKKTTKKTVTKVARKEPIEKAIAASDNNLTLILGITKNIQNVLKVEGIVTFKDLGKCTMKKLLLIIESAGLTDKANYYTTWTKQAKLAAAEKLEEWEALKKEISLKK